jgi:hypothetical protein
MIIMKALLAKYKPYTDQNILPYTANDINFVMIDFMMGQLPEQSMLAESEDVYGSSGELHSVDIFLQIFGEPQTRKEYGDNYLLYYPLKDSKTLVISIDAFASVINRIQINDYVIY